MHGHLNVKKVKPHQSFEQSVFTTLHGVTCQNTWISTITAVRIANLAKFLLFGMVSSSVLRTEWDRTVSATDEIVS